MNMLAKTFFVSMLGLSAATVATSQTMNNDGPPPMDEIAADLGVTVADLENCGPDEAPARGERPSREEHEERMETLATCLQGANAAITAEMIHDVMEEYRPAPPDRG
ncbi:hypothetical protein [Yoonia sp. BS5-3]|uniref:Uncharacterized protein n=1 Tax=Yoonia phaeophyticola TaxID=3137369 RepID=A0ABZ2V3I3_9RHOB